jgi:hypothetical protein
MPVSSCAKNAKGNVSWASRQKAVNLGFHMYEAVVECRRAAGKRLAVVPGGKLCETKHFVPAMRRRCALRARRSAGAGLRRIAERLGKRLLIRKRELDHLRLGNGALRRLRRHKRKRFD